MGRLTLWLLAALFFILSNAAWAHEEGAPQEDAPTLDAGAAPLTTLPMIALPAPAPMAFAPAVISAPPPVTPGLPEESAGPVKFMLKAVREKRWAMAAGGLLMLLVWQLRKVYTKVNKRWLPAITLAMGGLPALSLALMKPDVDPDEIITALFAIWLMANGSWSGIVEPFKALFADRAAGAVQEVAEKAEAPPAPETKPPAA